MSREPKARRRPRPALVLVAILAAAAVVRIVFLAELGRSELGLIPSLDARFYEELAHGIAAGERLPPGALTFNPLYPVFLVAVHRLFGEGALAPRVVQAVVGMLTIVLVYLGGRRIVVGPKAGRPSSGATAAAAAVMAALYAPFVLYEGMLLATTLEIFLLAAAFVLSLAADHALRGAHAPAIAGRPIPPWLLGLLLGACCGAGALGRPNMFLLLAAALPLWLFVRFRRRRRGLVPAIFFVAGAALFLGPPIVHNARETGRFVPVTAHGGINFYIGNRPGTPGVYAPPDDMRGDMRGLLEDARRKAEAETGRPLTDAEVSDFYMNRALEGIGRDPGGWLRLLVRKLVLFLNHVEVPDVPNVHFIERSCGVLRLLFLPFAAIAPLAVAGFLALWRTGRNRAVTAIFLGAAVLSVLLFFVNTRYRLPAVPVLVILASFFVVWSAREVSRRRFKHVSLFAAAALVVFALASARTVVRLNHSAAYTFLGNYHIERGEEAKAQQAFAEAYRLDPSHVEAMINYARVLMRRGDVRAAAPLYARAYELIPHFPRLVLEYGSALEQLGRRTEARRLYEEGLSAERTSERVLACRLLAQAALAEGDREEAIRWVRRATEIAPDDPELGEMLRWLEGVR